MSEASTGICIVGVIAGRSASEAAEWDGALA